MRPTFPTIYKRPGLCTIISSRGETLELFGQSVLVRGSPTCGPAKYVKHVHADSLLIHSYFSSKLMVLVRFQTDRILIFRPVRSSNFELMKLDQK